ncbi:hypothetical protein EYF80_000389 [Liparis tanakae]|uniref:Uncharacterized protein n=1 Tax=Liparis tanakae TaxID=230148 RepID=A0A4Z2JGK1_9TELE|nr:hypothetical protein EYF80_000389 [Liparis tanakae]
MQASRKVFFNIHYRRLIFIATLKDFHNVQQPALRRGGGFGRAHRVPQRCQSGDFLFEHLHRSFGPKTDSPQN